MVLQVLPNNGGDANTTERPRPRCLPRAIVAVVALFVSITFYAVYVEQASSKAAPPAAGNPGFPLLQTESVPYAAHPSLPSPRATSTSNFHITSIQGKRVRGLAGTASPTSSPTLVYATPSTSLTPSPSHLPPALSIFPPYVGITLGYDGSVVELAFSLTSSADLTSITWSCDNGLTQTVGCVPITRQDGPNVTYVLSAGLYTVSVTSVDGLGSSTTLTAAITIAQPGDALALGVDAITSSTSLCYAGRTCAIAALGYSFPSLPARADVYLCNAPHSPLLLHSGPVTFGSQFGYTWDMNPAFPIGDVNITVAVSVLFPQPGPPPTLLQTGTLTVSVTAAYTWAVTQFGPCAAGCGPGLAYRDVSCTDAETGDSAPVLFCAQLSPKPSVSSACFSTFSCANNASVARYQAFAGDWGPCSAPCGPGNQTRSVQCIDALTGEVLANAFCPSLPPSIRTCFVSVCASHTLLLDPPAPCSIACGAGVTSQHVSCVSSVDGVVPIDKCIPSSGVPTGPNVYSDGGVITVSCLEPHCTDTYRWTTSPTGWGSCSSSCGGGVSTRPLYCTNAVDGSLSSRPAIDCGDTNDIPFLSIPCNGYPCTSIGNMSAPVVVTMSECDMLAPPPPTTDACGPCSPCDATACSGHGVCAPSNGSCVCSGGFTGAFCQTPPGCVGFIDRLGVCCPPGSVLDYDFVCCTTTSTDFGSYAVPILSSNGTCCPNGDVNACGVCGGPSGAVMSITGECCTNGIADASGICCPSGHLDVFGICDGLSSSGTQVVSLLLVPPSPLPSPSLLFDPVSPYRLTLMSALENGLANALGRTVNTVTVTYAIAYEYGLLVNITIWPYGGYNLLPLSSLSSTLSSLAIPSSLGPINITDLFATQWFGVCGNGVCELDERPDPLFDHTGCVMDCPLPLLRCPVTAGGVCNGRGVCLPSSDLSSSLCACWAAQGYAGVDCSDCAAGFVRAGDTCVRLELPPGHYASPSPSVTPSPPSNKPSLVFALVVSVPVVVVSVCVLILLLCVWCRPRLVMYDTTEGLVALTHKKRVTSKTPQAPKGDPPLLNGRGSDEALLFGRPVVPTLSPLLLHAIDNGLDGDDVMLGRPEVPPMKPPVPAKPPPKLKPSDIAAVNNAAGVKKKPRPMSAAAGGRRREREGRDFEYTPTAIAAVSDLARAEATKRDSERQGRPQSAGRSRPLSTGPPSNDKRPKSAPRARPASAGPSRRVHVEAAKLEDRLAALVIRKDPMPTAIEKGYGDRRGNNAAPLPPQAHMVDRGARRYPYLSPEPPPSQRPIVLTPASGTPSGSHHPVMMSHGARDREHAHKASSPSPSRPPSAGTRRSGRTHSNTSRPASAGTSRARPLSAHTKVEEGRRREGAGERAGGGGGEERRRAVKPPPRPVDTHTDDDRPIRSRRGPRAV